MNTPNFFFPQNIKFLRERKHLTQEQLAKKLIITRSKLGALESGQTAAPQPEDYLKYSEFFKVSVDTLMKVDLSRLGELKLRELESGNDVYITGTNIRVLAITVDKGNKENVEYVPVKAKAGYQSGYSDPEYIAKLPRFSMPNLPSGATFRMFPTTGDSMLPLPEGSDVLCRFVDDWTGIKPGTLCILILKGVQDFVFKKATIKLEDRSVLLESLNTMYQPYEVPIDQVLEIWKYHSYQSRQIPEPIAETEHIARTVNEILSRIKVLENDRIR